MRNTTQHSITVNPRELCTLLAALKLYETFHGHEELDLAFRGLSIEETHVIRSLASQGGYHLPLTGEEVETLCTRVLNGHGKTRSVKRKMPTQKTRKRS